MDIGITRSNVVNVQHTCLQQVPESKMAEASAAVRGGRSKR
jgi:hypothetical protein